MAFKITVKGEASTHYHNKSELDGIDCQDNFAEYFDDDFTFKDDIESGYMEFEYDPKQDKLFAVTTYYSNRELTLSELDVLEDYTSGQWSDGIGEGFEQYPCMEDEDGEEVYVSPWFYGQTRTIEQTELK